MSSVPSVVVVHYPDVIQSVSVVPVHEPDVLLPPVEEKVEQKESTQGGHNLLKKITPNRAPSPLEYTVTGRKITVGNSDFSNLQVSELWTRTLRASFVNLLRTDAQLSLADRTNTKERASIMVVDDAFNQFAAQFARLNLKHETRLWARRGYVCRVNLVFNRQFNKRTDIFYLVIKNSDSGGEINVECRDGFTDSKTGWKINTVLMKRTQATVFLKVPDDCAYGLWTVHIQTKYCL